MAKTSRYDRDIKKIEFRKDIEKKNKSNKKRVKTFKTYRLSMKRKNRSLSNKR
jgi:hypothetical protein